MGVDVKSLLATTRRHVEQLQLLGAQRLADFDVEEIPCIRIAVTGGSAA
jgi:hypothetical protein